MANQEHFDLLKQGVDTWNRWREKHLGIHPDLIGVDFSEADLHDVIDITIEELEKQAKSLQGATMPDGTIHP